MTRSEIEPRPPAPRADALTTMLRGGRLDAIAELGNSFKILSSVEGFKKRIQSWIEALTFRPHNVCFNADVIFKIVICDLLHDYNVIAYTHLLSILRVSI